MPTLLHLDSSPLGDASISRSLSAEYVKEWQAANPGGEVITRDLTASGLGVIDAEWIAAAYTPPASRTDAQNAKLALSDTLIGELKRADEYAIGAPMHNFTIPASLRLWIDQIARVGETFQYGANGRPQGLLESKSATFLIATGGDYGEGSQYVTMNFVQPYLTVIFGFLGVADPTFITAGGAAAVRSGQIEREEFLATHVATIRAGFQPA